MSLDFGGSIRRRPFIEIAAGIGGCAFGEIPECVPVAVEVNPEAFGCVVNFTILAPQSISILGIEEAFVDS